MWNGGSQAVDVMLLLDERLSVVSSLQLRGEQQQRASARALPAVQPANRHSMCAMNQRSHRGAERLAAALNLKPRIDTADALAVLRALPFSQNAGRRNVMAEHVQWIYSQCAGLTPSGLPSRLANRCPNVVRLLARLMAEHDDREGGAFYPFTSITMNFNYQSREHRDTFHVGGRSRIIALGDYDGGELRLRADDAAPAEAQLLDVKQRWLDFDGTLRHETAPFEGERYSLIYFVHETALHVHGADRQPLLDLGFRWPEEQAAVAAEVG